jgi:4'-phosphopantetheinyl transferase EntD
MMHSSAQGIELARAAKGLLGPSVSVGCSVPAWGDAADLLPAELPCTAGMVPERRKEFAAGRAAVRMATMADGSAPFAVPMGADRAPVWPAGMIGSIAHSADICLAAISRSKRYAAIGIDIEPNVPLGPDIAAEVVHEGDGLELDSGTAPLAEHDHVTVFSAKEAAYKCQFPLTGTVLGFDALSIRLLPHAHRFVARFEVSVGGFRAGDTLDGGYALVGDHVLTVASIPAERWEKLISCKVEVAHG